MTIRHLKIFVEVADTGSMSAAAKNCFISQPTVSQAIRELEEHYRWLCSSAFPESFSLLQRAPSC